MAHKVKTVPLGIHLVELAAKPSVSMDSPTVQRSPQSSQNCLSVSISVVRPSFRLGSWQWEFCVQERVEPDETSTAMGLGNRREHVLLHA